MWVMWFQCPVGRCILSCVNCETIGAADNTCAYTCVCVCVYLWPHTHTRDKTGDETWVLPMSDQPGEQTLRQQLVGNVCVCVCAKKERERKTERIERERET